MHQQNIALESRWSCIGCHGGPHGGIPDIPNLADGLIRFRPALVQNLLDYRADCGEMFVIYPFLRHIEKNSPFSGQVAAMALIASYLPIRPVVLSSITRYPPSIIDLIAIAAGWIFLDFKALGP